MLVGRKEGRQTKKMFEGKKLRTESGGRTRSESRKVCLAVNK